MRLTVVGWYGTETIGDRAILDGIINIFLDEKLEVNIGSLYPFFTERTLFEDDYEKKYPKVKFNCFDIFNPCKMKKYVKSSDYVVMGGGPIMNLNELSLIIQSFRIARKSNSKTVLLGCGYGPISGKYVNMAVELFKLSDIIIFRDSESKNNAQKLLQDKEMYYLEDPAIISVLKYRENHKKDGTRNYAMVNFREFPSGYYGTSKFSEKEAIEIVSLLTDIEKVYLFPMHTFFIGGDDRDFFYKMESMGMPENVEILSKPKSIFEIYELIMNAQICVGMRYHSVVIQTLLNGNNYIINYTGKNSGKIVSFLKDIGAYEKYNDSICSISESENSINFTRDRQIYQYIGDSSDDIISKYRTKLGLI